jgi:hypothetical protein
VWKSKSELFKLKGIFVCMKKYPKVSNFILISIFISSCTSRNFVVAPSFTSVDKITLLEPGQNLNEVNGKLNVEPYDIVSGGDIFLCYYNYRLLERKIPIANSNKNRSINDVDSLNLSSELSQTTGIKFYTEWKKLFVFFKDGKLVSFITSDGLNDANYLMLVNGSIKLLSENDLDFSHFSKNSNFNLSGQVNNSNNNSNKDRDIIENILFPINYKKEFDFKRKDNKVKNSNLNLRLFK